MKKIVKISILTLLYFVYRITGLFSKKKDTVFLMYHSIGGDRSSLVVTPEDFERQIKYLKNDPNDIVITFDDGYQDFATTAWPILKKYNILAMLFIHTSRSSENLGNNFPFLDWSQIRELANEGVVMGSHSHGHSNMKLLSQEELERDINMSEDIFRRELGQVPEIFAYPGGKYNNEVAEFLRRRGYKKAYTIDEGVVLPGDDPMKLKRVGIGGHTSMWEFKIMITRAFNWYQMLRKSFGFKK